MTQTETDRVERGRALAEELNPGVSVALFAHLNNVVPDFESLGLGSVMADIWGREQLSKRERSIIRLAVISATEQPDIAVQTAIGTAFRLGLSKDDIAEVFVQTIPQVGLVRVIAGLEVLSGYLDSHPGK